MMFRGKRWCQCPTVIYHRINNCVFSQCVYRYYRQEKTSYVWIIIKSEVCIICILTTTNILDISRLFYCAPFYFKNQVKAYCWNEFSFKQPGYTLSLLTNWENVTLTKTFQNKGLLSNLLCDKHALHNLTYIYSWSQSLTFHVSYYSKLLY